jgi:hypothetical protein
MWPPLWPSGQNSWLQIQRSWVRFPELPDFLRSSGSGTGSTQPREYNWGATWMEKKKLEINGREDPLRWPRDTLYPQKLALTSPTSGGRSVGMVRLRAKASEFVFFRQHVWNKQSLTNSDTLAMKMRVFVTLQLLMKDMQHIKRCEIMTLLNSNKFNSLIKHSFFILWLEKIIRKKWKGVLFWLKI